MGRNRRHRAGAVADGLGRLLVHLRLARDRRVGRRPPGGPHRAPRGPRCRRRRGACRRFVCDVPAARRARRLRRRDRHRGRRWLQPERRARDCRCRIRVPAHRPGERVGDLVRGPTLAPAVGSSHDPRGGDAARLHAARGIRVGLQPRPLRRRLDRRPGRRARVANPRGVRVPPLRASQPRPSSMVGVAARVDPTRHRVRTRHPLLQARHRDAQQARHVGVRRSVQHRVQVRRPRQLHPARAPHAAVGADGRGVAARHRIAAQPFPPGLRVALRGRNRAHRRLRVHRPTRGRAAVRNAVRTLGRRRPLSRRRGRDPVLLLSLLHDVGLGRAQPPVRVGGAGGSCRSTPASTSC